MNNQTTVLETAGYGGALAVLALFALAQLSPEVHTSFVADPLQVQAFTLVVAGLVGFVKRSAG